MAKVIASGYPISLLAMRRDIGDRKYEGKLGSTYIGNCIACAAACTYSDGNRYMHG